MNSSTHIAHTTPASADGFDSLSVPTFRGSTITFTDYASFSRRGARPRSSYTYGLAGTPTTRTLQNKLTELEGAADTFLTPSGLMAITTAILATCSDGDRVLLPDNVYPPVRRFAATMLARMGIDAAYYHPRQIDERLLAAGRVRLIWVEAPGSTTMEIPDFAAIRLLADRYGAMLGCDNSWASPLLCRPIDLGADLVVEAVTKYLAGHSDILLGSISVRNEQLAAEIHDGLRALGVGVSPDDCFLALRGIETAAVRLSHAGTVALELANFLKTLECVAEVLHPALESSPDHDRWKSQFSGASGLFSVVLKGEDETRFAARFDNLRTFRLGASWGGTQSIMAPVILDRERTVDRTYAHKPIVRMSVGLEAKEDLLCELKSCFQSC